MGMILGLEDLGLGLGLDLIVQFIITWLGLTSTDVSQKTVD